MDGPQELEPDYRTTVAHAPAWAAHGPADRNSHMLVSRDDTGRQQRIVVDRYPFTIGRVRPADLVLDSAMVSRRHCAFSEVDGSLMITDLGSTNGTFVDDVKLEAPQPLSDGMVVRIGPYLLRYERRDGHEIREALAQDRDLIEASRYVASILPQPLSDGPVRTEWAYEPSTRLGGDAFGYRQLDDRHFALFLLDVSGHGTGSALHAVSVANALRQRLLPNVDFRDPTAVIESLNAAFMMETHNELFFTIWYGVYDLASRVLAFVAAGHHPAFLLSAPGTAPVPLGTRNPAVGITTGRTPVKGSALIPPGASLCVFSDGVFEATDRDGRQWTLADLLPLLPLAAEPGGIDVLRRRIRELVRPGSPDDDFSFLAARFP